MESGLEIFISLSAVMIVLGGTLAAILIGHPFKDVMKVMRVASNVFRLKIKDPELKEFSVLGLTVFIVSALSESLWTLQFPIILFILIVSISVSASFSTNKVTCDN